MILVALAGLEFDLPGKPDELIRAWSADQGRVAEPSVLSGRPAAAGEVADFPWPLSMVVADSCTLGSTTMSFFAPLPPKTMIRSMLPIAGSSRRAGR